MYQASFGVSVKHVSGAAWDQGRICDTPQGQDVTPLGPYRRPMPRVLGGSQGGGRFLMGEVPL